MINGDRIRQAREFRGLTQTKLGQLMGISQTTIAQIEGGLYEPSREFLDALAQHTGFQEPFFSQDSADTFREGSLLFRARSSVTARERVEAYRHAQLIFEIAQKLEPQVNPIPVSIPKLSSAPPDAAQSVRKSWGLEPGQPIGNLTNMIEKMGVWVLALPVNLEKRDAFSLWAGKDSKIPVIATCGGKPGDRLRMSVAHELAHLVLHFDQRKSINDMEDEADRFAAELLMPGNGITADLRPPLTLTSIALLKPKWRVSIQALVRRAYDLSIVTERQYRYLFEQISIKGWRMEEPKNLDVPLEKPRALRKMAELVYGNPINYHRLASDVSLSVSTVKQILDCYALPRSSDVPTSTKKVVAFRPR